MIRVSLAYEEKLEEEGLQPMKSAPKVESRLNMMLKACDSKKQGKEGMEIRFQFLVRSVALSMEFVASSLVYHDRGKKTVV